VPYQHGMARDYRHLIVWQLADELQTETLKLLETTAWSRDVKLHDETDKTLSQIKRNIPEGFRKTSHLDFARFLEYSHASLGELRSLFSDAQKKRYVTAAQLRMPLNLCYRLERALLNFIRYLRGNDPPPWWNFRQQ
jgi:four helix bundle protein